SIQVSRNCWAPRGKRNRAITSAIEAYRIASKSGLLLRASPLCNQRKRRAQLFDRLVRSILELLRRLASFFMGNEKAGFAHFFLLGLGHGWCKVFFHLF